MSLSEYYLDVIEKRITTIPSPLSRLHACLGGGFREGQVSVVAGTPGSGKSYILVQHMLHWTNSGIPWAYRPLEDSKIDVQQRLLALSARSWSPVTPTEDAALEAADMMMDSKHANMLKLAGRCIVENVLREDCDVNNWNLILAWIKEQADAGARMIIVDPVSQINFVQEYKRSFDLENQFMQKITGFIKSYPAHVILICHVSKGEGGKGSIRGSAAFSNLAHNDIRIIGHEDMESTIFVQGGATDTVIHNKTIYVAKARNGTTGRMIAAKVGNCGPEFVELGYMAPKQDHGGRGRGR